MAERRMFTKKVTDSDEFLDMPMSAQCLYFHLSMAADDDGFLNNPKTIQRKIGASADDLKLLLAKQFILVFDSGVIVIKHWKLHNYIQSDRYKPTDFVEEKSHLTNDKNKGYVMTEDGLNAEQIEDVSKMYPNCIQNVSVGKVRLGKVRLGKVSNNIPPYIPPCKPEQVISYFDNTDLDNTFRDFIKFRKEIHKPMTDKAIKLAIDKLEKLAPGNDAMKIEIINQSIMNGYMGLFELKQSNVAARKSNLQQKFDEMDEWARQKAEQKGDLF